MSTLDQKFLCEVVFRDFKTNKVLRVTGKTDIDKLISPKRKIIILENIIFQNQQWKKISCKLPKVDIIKISAFKAQIILNYDKGTLIVDQNQIQEVEGITEYKNSTLII